MLARFFAAPGAPVRILEVLSFFMEDCMVNGSMLYRIAHR
jgi:hypothetical protein